MLIDGLWAIATRYALLEEEAKKLAEYYAKEDMPVRYHKRAKDFLAKWFSVKSETKGNDIAVNDKLPPYIDF
jgi:hypothetical protein